MGDKDIDSQLNVFSMGELFKEFIKNLTPVVYFYNWTIDLVLWR